jgi:pimeloyl-ACP methyl ester carboxylesterase
VNLLRPTLVGLSLLLAACGGSDAAAPAASPSPSSVVTDGAFAGRVDLGDGRHVYVRCAGTGSPAVVFENGDESTTGQWAQVIAPVAERTRTCAYDRVGNGASDNPTGCRRSPELRGDLEALLRAVRLPAPYVLAGTSGGGYLVANFAYAHPADVAGMLIAETARAIDPARAPADLLAELKCDSPRNQEQRDYVSVENDAWSHRHRIGDIPLVVISNDYGAAAVDAEQRTNVADQRGWLVLSPQGRQVVVRSGHDVPENEPELVVRELLAMLPG